jgi:PAS domain S-box-containing protein
MQAEQVNILLVDDNPMNLITLEAILDKPDYNLVRATSGREALDYLQQLDFALVLLDVQMPNMDGFETAEHIRKIERSRHTPIIFITAIYPDDIYVERGYALGAADFLYKPINPERLLTKVLVFVNLFREAEEAKIEKQREEALSRAALAEINSILERISDAYIALDTQWHYTYVNKKAAEYLRKPKSELLGKNIWELFPDLVGSKLYTEIQEAMAKQMPAKIETHFEPFNEWYENEIYPSSNGLSIFWRNITVRKRAEDELRESEKRFRHLADAMPQIVWMARPDGRIDYYNKRWYEFTGLPEGKEGNESWTPVLHPDDVQLWMKRWYEAVKTGETYDLEYRFKDYKTGAYRWHLGRALPVRDEMGGIVRWFGTSTDIDDQKKIEASLKQANRLKDEFLTTISHELRTPLTSILGWAKMLQMDKVEEVNYSRAIDTIARNAELQARIVDDILDISKMITGKLTLEVRPTDIMPIVEAAVNVIRPAADAKEIKLRMVLDTSVGSVLADANRIKQIVWNLLSNAVKFTPRRGNVQIELERINSHVEITVTDTGQGIAPEFLPHVFERFRQADNSITRSHGGLGLGLALVRQLVELHGGTVHVYSEGKAKGATFTIKLPLISTDEQKISQKDSPFSKKSAVISSCDLTGLRVLIVDDELDTLGMLGVILENNSAEVKSAASAAEALEVISNWKPDILVSDIGMPGENGYELIRKVRAMTPERGGQIPAVALTAYARDEDRKLALSAGYQMHIAKPFQPDELLLIISNLTDRTPMP